MAAAIGARPSIFFGSTDSKEIYVVHTAVSDAKASKGERYASFECKRGLLALAFHPSDASVLFQLHDDLTVSAWGLQGGQRTAELLWSRGLSPGSTEAKEVADQHIVPCKRLHACQLTGSSKALKVMDCLRSSDAREGELICPFGSCLLTPSSRSFGCNKHYTLRSNMRLMLFLQQDLFRLCTDMASA